MRMYAMSLFFFVVGFNIGCRRNEWNIKNFCNPVKKYTQKTEKLRYGTENKRHFGKDGQNRNRKPFENIAYRERRQIKLSFRKNVTFLSNCSELTFFLATYSFV